MNLQDDIFAEDAENDVTLFARDTRRKRVLIFPPVNSYRRFIIHQLVQERFEDLLKTFSIGQGIDRRTVVCFRSDFISDPAQIASNGDRCKADAKITDSRRPSGTTSGAMGVEEPRRLSRVSASPDYTGTRQVKTSPTVEIYRPPALRRAEKDNRSSASARLISDDAVGSSAKVGRQRRPDRAVYVPKHRRISTEADESAVAGPQSPAIDDASSPPAPRSRCDRSKTSSPCRNENHSRKGRAIAFDRERNERNSSGSGENERLDVTSKSATPSEYRNGENNDNCETRENDASSLDTDARSVTNTTTTTTTTSTTDRSGKNSDTVEPLSPVENQRDSDIDSTPPLSPNTIEIVDNIVAENENDFVTNGTGDCEEPKIISESKGPNFREFTMKKIDRPESRNRDELANDKNLRETSARGASNVLVISDTKIGNGGDEKIVNSDKENANVAVAARSPEKKPKKVARAKSKPASPPSPSIKLNRDECDWDSLFDDNGECLDPTLIEELTTAVGEVAIEHTKNDYKDFVVPADISGEEFGHVVEIYNFPSDYKTSDLAAVFGPWKNGGFELKWVDDTHCLGVFGSPLIAAEVLVSDHPFVKTRPLSAATASSKMKARKSVEFLQPYKSRPQTCAALARRLVTGALGVKLATARQEREQEKLVLREAKEKRRLANKQRDDIWEGIIAEK